MNMTSSGLQFEVRFVALRRYLP